MLQAGAEIGSLPDCTAFCKGPGLLVMFGNSFELLNRMEQAHKNKTMQMNRGKLTGAQDIGVCRLKACCLCLRVISLSYPQPPNPIQGCEDSSVVLFTSEPICTQQREKGRDSVFIYSVLPMLVLHTVLGANESFVVMRKESIPGTHNPDEAFECQPAETPESVPCLECLP